MSTTEVGNVFRDQICTLLRTKYPDAEVERRIDGTKVDIHFTAAAPFGATKRYAVECKDYARTLTKDDLGKIRMFYAPMQQNGSVDEVLIISRKPLNDAAGEFVRSWANATHRTVDELGESLLGIRPYVEELADTKPVEDTPYIEGRIDDQAGTALEFVDEWIQQSQGRGLAIRGSYGQGKTSFANRLASLYARRHLADPGARIPILHRLGTVVHETRLEGLFGAKFTADDARTDFRFSTFEHLNRAGRLLVILDGFDEMKHAMSASDFLSNFEEFNRLLTGDAKVILLGRPNALPTDTEELVFRGRRTVGGQLIASSAYLPWEERRLAYFTKEETLRLLTASLDSLMRRHAANHAFTYPADFLQKRIAEVLALVPEDLLKRPVHVSIVAELGSNPEFSFEGFNEYLLYEHFIREMVERDGKKKARRGIPIDDRLKFQRELAWWSWSRLHAAQGFFLRREIPKSLIEGLSNGRSADDEGKLNEYIVSSLTEEKQAGALFFAHRSFQEFLVAERARVAPLSPRTLTEYSTFLTSDVLRYLTHAPDAAFTADWYEVLRGSDGPFSATLLSFLARYPNVVSMAARNLTARPDGIDPWSLFILGLGLRGKTDGGLKIEQLNSFIRAVIVSAKPAAAAAAALTALLLVRRAGAGRVSLVIPIIGALLERALRRSREMARMSLTVESENMDFALRWLAGHVSKDFPGAGSTAALALLVDLGRLEDLCSQELHGGSAGTHSQESVYGAIYPNGSGANIRVEAQKVFDALGKELRDEYSPFLYARTSNFHITEVKRVKPKGQLGEEVSGAAPRAGRMKQVVR
ncbi:NACHT domain-containing protein [Variovorax soli]|uniref:NACHT domain-containing protein n=1 Tax=Variovorax soli TaxID=376815 RepID=UPI0008384536|nr:NACHT domain-containing protein [Variovorax soli]